MASLKETILADLKSALKQGKAEIVSVLRMLLAQIHNEEIDKKSELSDEQIIQIIKKEIKKREQAITIYEEKNDEEFAEKEKQEIKILEKYLPPMLSETEIEALVDEVIKKENIKKGDFGKLMSLVMKQVGNRAEGRLVSEIAKKKLESIDFD